MRYTIGLDLGTTSVGWAVVDNEKKHIHDLGVRVFESAENPKDGKSLAEPRRLARSARRRLARRHGRLEATKDAFVNAGVSSDDIQKAHAQPNNPHQLRAEGLDRLLSPIELFIAVYHIVKRRGYKSNRKSEDEDTKDDEKKAVLNSIKANQEKIGKNESIRTVGELLYKEIQERSDSLSFDGVRNKPGSYTHSVSREMLAEELNQLFEAQKRLGNTFVTDTLREAIVGEKGAFTRQKHYATGDVLKKMVGFCTFLNRKNGAPKNEMRAAKATYTFQYFNVLQKLNHITLRDATGGSYLLTPEQRETARAYLLSIKVPTYNGLRTKLKLSENERFNMVHYYVPKLKKKSTDEKEGADAPLFESEIVKQAEGKTKLPSMATYLELQKVISVADKGFWVAIDANKRIIDDIATILTLYKTDEDINTALDKINLYDKAERVPDTVRKALLKQSYSTFGRLSLKALQQMIPHFEAGMTYDEAVKAAGYREYAPKKQKRLQPLPKDDHTLTNPVVKRTVSQSIKVVNAIIDAYGSPEEVHIELARELSKNHKERRDIEKHQKENTDRNNDAVCKIKELYGITEPKGYDIIKYKLWQEQNNKCGYSGKLIDERRLFEDGYVEVDHIVPYSRSFDDSFNNKVLVLKQENQEKANRTPWEYMGADEKRWSEFEALVASFQGISPRKRANLLSKKKVFDELTARTLNDTRYIAKYLKNYIENELEFSEGAKKKRVLTVNGAAVAYLRKRWGLNKDRVENDKHHAQDAAIVAVVNDALVTGVARHAKCGEVRAYLAIHKGDISALPDMQDPNMEYLRSEPEQDKRLPEPWEGFRYELTARLADDPLYELEAKKEKIPWFAHCAADELPKITPIFVSRMPHRKVTGRAHAETLRSPKQFIKEQEMSTTRCALTNLTEKKLTDNGKNLDPKLVKGLLARLRDERFDGKADKAFKEPFHKTTKKGERGPVVRSVKLVEAGQKSGLLINDGKALVDQSSMIRVDVFAKANTKGKREYYFVPVYAHHRTKKELPNKIVSSKPESEWDSLNDSYEFLFSLFKNDLMYVGHKEEEKSGFWYYQAANRNNVAFSVESHDRGNKIESLGIKTLDKLDKYVVYLLGHRHKVKKETRQPLHTPKRT